MYTKSSLSRQYSWYGWLVCSLAALFYCYEYLLRIEPSVMALPLRHHFASLSAGGLGILSSTYYWAYVPMQAVVGVTTDRYGPKRSLTLAILLCAIGTFIFTETSSISVAAAGRFIVGCGSAFAFVGVLKLAAMWLPERYFALFTGLTTSLGMFGALVGDIGMTWMVKAWGWQHVLLLSVFTGLLLVPIFYFFVHDKIVHEPVRKPNDTFALFFKGFTQLLRNRSILLTGIIGCLMYLPLSAFGEMWGIPFLERLYPHQHMLASTLNSMVFLGWLIAGPINGWLSQCLKSRRRLLIIGAIGSGISIGIIVLHPSMSVYLLGALLLAYGMFSSTQILCFAIGRDYVHAKLAATAASMINMLVMLSGMLIQPLMSKILDWVWHGQMLMGLRIYSVNDYRIAMLALPITMFISIFLILFMRESFHAEKI